MRSKSKDRCAQRQKIKDMKIGQFLTYDIWRISMIGMSRWKRLSIQVIKVLVMFHDGFNSKRLNLIAQGLTSSLLFALIPILAMVLAVARGFGFAGVIQESLNQSFLKETNLVPHIMEMVERYLDTAQGGVFIGVGIAILLWAVYSFFNNVEQTFDKIWDIEKSRSPIRKAANYLAIVVLIPVLLIMTSGMSILLKSAPETLRLMLESERIHSGLLRFVQLCVSWFIFSWMYISIPNTKVELRSALIPGIIIGTLFQLLQMLSVYIIMYLGRTNIVYGAFASLPILLMFLQWTCMLMMIGAELSYAIQNNKDFAINADPMDRKYSGFDTISLGQRRKKPQYR